MYRLCTLDKVSLDREGYGYHGWVKLEFTFVHTFLVSGMCL